MAVALYHYAIRKLFLLGCAVASTSAADIDWLDTLAKVAAVDSSDNSDTISSVSPEKNAIKDTDNKRRTHIVMEHQEWPRRIKNIVRDGKICLDMTTDQLIASWGEPMQRDSSFISDKVNYRIWIFKGKNGDFVSVNIIAGKVRGWSL
jgi:hypothetical protein